MRTHIELVGLLLIAVLLVGGILLYQRNQMLHSEVLRQRENTTALLHSMDTLRDAYGRATAESARLRLSEAELTEHRGALQRQIKAMGIRLQRVQSIAQAATETTASFTGRIDTVYYPDTASRRVDTLSRLQFHDAHVRITATLDSTGQFQGEFHSVDTLFQVIHRVPRKFLFFQWGTRGIRQTIRTSNPHTRIVYSEYIELE